MARLREAGYRVVGEQPQLPRSEAVRADASTDTQQAIIVDQDQRMELARVHREWVQQATRGMMECVAAADPLDLFEAMQVSSLLVGQVSADPIGLVALTSLRLCDDYTIEHSADVSILMVAIAFRLGWDADRVRELSIAGLVQHRNPPAVRAKPAFAAGRVLPRLHSRLSGLTPASRPHPNARSRSRALCCTS